MKCRQFYGRQSGEKDIGLLDKVIFRVLQIQPEPHIFSAIISLRHSGKLTPIDKGYPLFRYKMESYTFTLFGYGWCFAMLLSSATFKASPVGGLFFDLSVEVSLIILYYSNNPLLHGTTHLPLVSVYSTFLTMFLSVLVNNLHLHFP